MKIKYNILCNKGRYFKKIASGHLSLLTTNPNATMIDRKIYTVKKENNFVKKTDSAVTNTRQCEENLRIWKFAKMLVKLQIYNSFLHNLWQRQQFMIH